MNALERCIVHTQLRMASRYVGLARCLVAASDLALLTRKAGSLFLSLALALYGLGGFRGSWRMFRADKVGHSISNLFIIMSLLRMLA